MIDAGADVNISNKNGKTALSVIKDLSNKLTKMLKNAGAKESSSSKSTSNKNSNKRLKYKKTQKIPKKRWQLPIQKARTQQKIKKSLNQVNRRRNQSRRRKRNNNEIFICNKKEKSIYPNAFFSS